MLTAILNSKAGRVLLPGTEVSVRWRELFQRSEDLLTAVFFGRLPYLSNEGLEKVLGLLLGSDAATSMGGLIKTEFWPHLTGTGERSWVEPDVLLSFENAALLIEVKPPFGGCQREEQWVAEVDALLAAYLNGSREPLDQLHFLALGQNKLPAETLEQFEIKTSRRVEFKAHAQEWEIILSALPEWRNSGTRQDQAILDDWLNAFSLFELEKQVDRGWSAMLSWEYPRMALTALAPWQIYLPEAPRTEKPQKSDTANPWLQLLEFAYANTLELQSWKCL